MLLVHVKQRRRGRGGVAQTVVGVGASILATTACGGEGRDFSSTRAAVEPSHSVGGETPSLPTAVAPVPSGVGTVGPVPSGAGTVGPGATAPPQSSVTVGAGTSPNAPKAPGTPDEPTLGCGNGEIEDGEMCDDGAFNDDERVDACRSDCRTARCGDRVTDTGEQCDGGQDCTFDCRLVLCGNSYVEEGEECDPPQASVCTASCRRIWCGNGIIDENETCEPPGAGGCNQACRFGVCGDHEVGTGEACDPPLPGFCDSTCHLVECGDGFVGEGEGCEPPGTSTCDDECRSVGCGNGTRDGAEECEPPNQGTCDGQCRVIACGNQRVDFDEECDPPKNGSCDAECRSIICGNSRVDSGESCDPPLAGQCNNQCQTIRCGDGRLDSGEQCEPQASGDASCSAQCIVTNEAGTKVLYTFDSHIDPWKLYSTSPSNLEASTVLSYDSQNGDVSPGVLRVEAPFTGSNQKVEFQATFAESIDMAGRVLRARVRLGSGLSSDPANPGGIKFFAKAGGGFNYASGEWTYLSQSGWTDVTLVADAPILVPTEFDASDVRQVGFELRTFTETTQVSRAVVYIDSVTY